MALPLVTFPEPPTSSLPRPTADRLQAVIADAVAGSSLGVSASIIVGDHGTWSGFAGGLDGDALRADQRWYTGSIAKTVVAAQVQRLVERGRVDLDAAAADLISPDRQLETNGATVRDLLRMRSGITSRVEPGTKWEYSNGDYILLGHLIESVEGRPLGDVLTDDILEVAGAEGLTFPADGTVDNAAGSLETDAASLAHWGYALFGGRLIDPSSLARMVAFDENGYGMGVFDFSLDFGQPAAGHLGVDGRWSAALVALPEQRIVLATLMDSSDWERTYRITTDLARALRP
jgi:D-alanyl-D-alanine carboxypeptidase